MSLADPIDHHGASRGHGALQALDEAIDDDRLLADVALLVDCQSDGGDETAAQLRVAEIAERLGLRVAVHEEDISKVRQAQGCPGEEVERERLMSVTATVPGRDGTAPRLAINGHIDVVPPGAGVWTTPPFQSEVRGGRLYGRGAADMKSGVVAALHAAAAVKSVFGAALGDVVVQSVGGEEDGGIGTFAALLRDADFAACVIPEPTAGTVVCATAGALTWHLRLKGRAAHACRRLDGVSALDRFLPVYEALRTLERRINLDVLHPLMNGQPLPYPLSVGTVQAGDWPSSVPDELVCAGRLGVPIGRSLGTARAEFEATVRAALADDCPEPEITWDGGQFAPAEISPDHALVRTVRSAAAEVLQDPPPLAGVSYGSDLRQFTERGIPTVLYGPGSILDAHSVDESVALGEIRDATRVLARTAARFSAA